MGIGLSGSRPKWESAGPQGLGGNRAAHRRAVTACACAGPGGSLPLRPVHAPAAPGQPPPPVSRAQSLTCAGGRSGRARAARCIAAAAHRTARRDRAPRCDARVALRSAQPERRAFPPRSLPPPSTRALRSRTSVCSPANNHPIVHPTSYHLTASPYKSRCGRALLSQTAASFFARVWQVRVSACARRMSFHNACRRDPHACVRRAGEPRAR